jgi:large subunit ribosomal protein L32
VAVPKRRKSRSQRDKRRANHDKVTAPNVTPCPNCSEPALTHRVCPSCGFYKGRKIEETGSTEAQA